MHAATYPDFEPRFPWRGPDLQTLRNVLRGPALLVPTKTPRTALELPMRDGSEDRLVAFRLATEPRACLRSDPPLVVLVHGLGGSSDSAYIQTSSAHLLELGYPVLQLNLRGAGASRRHCSAQYHAGRSRDLHDALAAMPPELNAAAAAAHCRSPATPTVAFLAAVLVCYRSRTASTCALPTT